MKHFLVLWALVCLVGVCCSGATITTRVSCSVVGLPVVVDASQCSAEGTYSGGSVYDGLQSSHATAGSQFFISGNLISEGTLTNNNSSFYAYSTAFSSVVTTVATSGPLRQGFLAGRYSSDVQGSSSAEFNLPLTQMSSPVASIYGTTWTIPLGTTLTFGSTSRANSDLFYGSALAGLLFQFFEADGVTPVAVSEVVTPAPEPGTWGVFLLAAAGAFAYISGRHWKPSRKA